MYTSHFFSGCSSLFLLHLVKPAQCFWVVAGFLLRKLDFMQPSLSTTGWVTDLRCVAEDFQECVSARRALFWNAWTKLELSFICSVTHLAGLQLWLSLLLRWTLSKPYIGSMVVCSAVGTGAEERWGHGLRTNWESLEFWGVNKELLSALAFHLYSKTSTWAAQWL